MAARASRVADWARTENCEIRYLVVVSSFALDANAFNSFSKFSWVNDCWSFTTGGGGVALEAFDDLVVGGAMARCCAARKCHRSRDSRKATLCWQKSISNYEQHNIIHARNHCSDNNWYFFAISLDTLRELNVWGQCAESETLEFRFRGDIHNTRDKWQIYPGKIRFGDIGFYAFWRFNQYHSIRWHQKSQLGVISWDERAGKRLRECWSLMRSYMCGDIANHKPQTTINCKIARKNIN